MASAHNSIGVTGNGSEDIFVAKINCTGNWEWAASAGGVNYDYPVSMVGRRDGSALVTGMFTRQSATFGSRSITYKRWRYRGFTGHFYCQNQLDGKLGMGSVSGRCR